MGGRGFTHLFRQKPLPKSDAAQNYKCMFGSYRGPLPNMSDAVHIEPLSLLVLCITCGVIFVPTCVSPCSAVCFDPSLFEITSHGRLFFARRLALCYGNDVSMCPSSQ